MPFSPAFLHGCKQEHDGTHFHICLGPCLLKEVMGKELWLHFISRKQMKIMETTALYYVFLWCLSLSNPVILTSVLYQTLFQNVPSFNIPPPPKQESNSLLSASQSSLTLPRHHLGRHPARGHTELRTRECSDVCSDVRD